MDDQFNDLQRLLRLKRHEAPPPDYFEDFLIEFHRRQRAELLRRPLWRLALDRLEGALPAFSPSRYAYAGACAAAVAATALASTHILTGGPAAGTLVASNAPAVPAGGESFRAPLSARAVAVNPPRINILTSRPLLRLSPELDFNRPRPAAVSYAGSRPRYVLDTQPVSYEKPYSF